MQEQESTIEIAARQIEGCYFAKVGIADNTLIVTFPQSPEAIAEIAYMSYWAKERSNWIYKTFGEGLYSREYRNWGIPVEIRWV